MLVNNAHHNSQSITLKGEELTLLPEKAIYWSSKGILMIADLHLGKASHFRSKGIAVPSNASLKNWILLEELFQTHKPNRVCFLGDLFHSSHNKEWETFGDLIKKHSSITFELIIGNHDILPHHLYENLGFMLHDVLIEGPFILTHEPLEEESAYYNLAGHIHPGVRLKGKAKQSHRAPCFYFGEKNGLLPAFGNFTGLASIPIKRNDQVFIIINSNVIPMGN